MKNKQFIKKKRLFKIVMTSVLIALNIILECYVPLFYRTIMNDINFGFIAVAFAACYLGIPYAMAVSGIGDIIGAILKATGTYFVGFTITNMLVGLCFALLLYKKASIIRVIVAVFINKTVCTLLLNTLFISALYTSGIHTYGTMLISRLPNACITLVIEIAVISLLYAKESKISSLIKKRMPY